MMKKKFYIIFFTHFAYGMVFNMFGPIIPFMAEESHKLQSDFTYVFVFRGIAYLISGFAQKGFLSQYNPIKRIMASCIVSGICYVLFFNCYQNYLLSSIICMIMFLANGSMQMLINVLLTSSSSKDAKQAIGFSYGYYGFGGVMGSVIVSILGSKALVFASIMTITIGIFYAFLLQPKTADKQPAKQSMITAQQIVEYDDEIKLTYLNYQTEMLFCIIFCIYAAISLSYRSWLPSFIVMEKLASKQVAAISISIYSAVLTIFRFVFMFWNPDIIKTLNYSTLILIYTLIASIFSFFLDIQIILIYGSSIVLGIIFSSYVPYIYALPSQFMLSFTETGTCNTIIAYAIGEAVITAFIGCLMNWIHPMMLFVMMFLFSLLNRFYIFKTIEELQNFEGSEKCPGQMRISGYEMKRLYSQ